jgi:hypothetical protein
MELRNRKEIDSLTDEFCLHGDSKTALRRYCLRCIDDELTRARAASLEEAERVVLDFVKYHPRKGEVGTILGLVVSRLRKARDAQ